MDPAPLAEMPTGEHGELWFRTGDMGKVYADEALPRNPTGKILKRDLRQPYWEWRDRATV